MSATAGQSKGSTRVAERLGLTAGMVVQELGADDDVDGELRAAVEQATGQPLVGPDYDDVLDAVLLWWRDGDGDLVDALVDALTDLADGGAVWLLTPKVGRPGYVDASDVTEAAPTAGLATTTSVAVAKDWTATRLVTPRAGGRR